MSEFFVGYLKLPPRLGRWLGRLAMALVIGGSFLGGVLASRLDSVGDGRYAFEQPEEFVGIVLEEPFPSLLVHEPLPVTVGAKAGFVRYWLVGRGKQGAQRHTLGLDRTLVTVRGERIERDGQHMIKLTETPTRLLRDDSQHILAIDTEQLGKPAGNVRVRGEIVDSQCFLGVMKPGHGRTHRGCAVRCLSGGVPPLLRVSAPSPSGLNPPTASYYLLVGPDGRAINRDLLPFVAQPFDVEGALFFYGTIAVLRINPSTLRARSLAPSDALR